MTREVPDILAKIVESKRRGLEAIRLTLPGLERQAADGLGSRRDFANALRANPPSIIAEVKKASPSKGLLCADFRPADIARAYERGGAACLSVLTDEQFFQGSIEDLQSARAATSLPVLRKDFTIGDFHVVEAAAAGADALLLIAAILPVQDLRRMRELAESYEMAALVEVHNDEELAAALDSGARIIGVNNRDLRTFQVTLETSLRLAGKMPPDAILVSESGIHSSADVRLLRAAGYHAFLVGEHLMKSPDPAAALESLRQ